MISTDITGTASGDASQVFNLLAVVANPELYGGKLKAIVAATEESKKYLALVGPASEIISIREQIELDKAKAKQVLADATIKAQSIIKDAQGIAQSISSEANTYAAKVKKNIAETESAIKAKLSDTTKANIDLQAKVAVVEAATKELADKQAELNNALEIAANEKATYISLQQEMTAKVKRFSEGLLK